MHWRVVAGLNTDEELVFGKREREREDLDSVNLPKVLQPLILLDLVNVL